LAIGLAGVDRFLMTGELHLPIPAMILAGPVYRTEIGFMTVLFLSTILISGPAWCSQLCYFGALDGLASKTRGSKKDKSIKTGPYKIVGLVLVVSITLLLKLLNVDTLIATVIALLFASGGLLVMLLISRKKGKMVHCLTYCPIGTIVNYTRFINPFRFKIDNSCTNCMRCIPVCKYDALNPENIKLKSPGITCTLCGDCVSACKPNSFYYKFPGLGPVASRNLYIGVTITLHAMFMALARI
jgi:polyferredoxin